MRHSQRQGPVSFRGIRLPNLDVVAVLSGARVITDARRHKHHNYSDVVAENDVRVSWKDAAPTKPTTPSLSASSDDGGWVSRSTQSRE